MQFLNRGLCFELMLIWTALAFFRIVWTLDKYECVFCWWTLSLRTLGLTLLSNPVCHWTTYPITLGLHRITLETKPDMNVNEQTIFLNIVHAILAYLLRFYVLFETFSHSMLQTCV